MYLYTSVDEEVNAVIQDILDEMQQVTGYVKYSRCSKNHSNVSMSISPASSGRKLHELINQELSYLPVNKLVISSSNGNVRSMIKVPLYHEGKEIGTISASYIIEDIELDDELNEAFSVYRKHMGEVSKLAIKDGELIAKVTTENAAQAFHEIGIKTKLVDDMPSWQPIKLKDEDFKISLF